MKARYPLIRNVVEYHILLKVCSLGFLSIFTGYNSRKVMDEKYYQMELLKIISVFKEDGTSFGVLGYKYQLNF